FPSGNCIKSSSERYFLASSYFLSFSKFFNEILCFLFASVVQFSRTVSLPPLGDSFVILSHHLLIVNPLFQSFFNFFFLLSESTVNRGKTAKKKGILPNSLHFCQLYKTFMRLF
ncbi:MAG: hypothetical protein PUJ72_06430, partial [Eubacteriales bacterium]|nr:hypothetical protein [Eubacteriales bacterium]